jgi:hypothetical protein
MRTKTLLLTAALSAAGIVSSMAQAGAVYSVNAVGYVNTVLKGGLNLVSNPLKATPAATIATSFGTALPNNSRVYKFNGTTYDIATYSTALGWNPPAAANLPLTPGEGVFVNNNGTADVTITFVGEVPQGTDSNVTIPVGFSIRSSAVPQTGTATDLQYPAANNDRIYRWNNANGSYSIFTFTGALGWTPTNPTINVGEAFFARNAQAATENWTRNFSVNQ